MLNILSDIQIRNLIKQINKIPRYKTILKTVVAIRPKKTDTDYSFKSIEDWDAKVRNIQNTIMNVEYLKDNIR